MYNVNTEWDILVYTVCLNYFSSDGYDEAKVINDLEIIEYFFSKI